MWDTKYRPLKFGDVLGQQGTVQLLKARLRGGTALDTSYIFSGGFGQGKTTLARILARALLCQDLSKDDPEPCNLCENCLEILAESNSAFVEMDAASRGTIDYIRAIVDDLPFAVFNAAKRVYLFDEAHRMSRDGQDVLLKPLEDKKMVGIFCTTEAEKIRGPIRSRCEEYAIRKITREDVLVRMQMILGKEGVTFEDDAVLTVIDYSGGHVRDVVNRLEMVAQMGDVNVANVREYLHLSVVSTYYEILLSLADSKQVIAKVESACDRVPADEVSAGLAEAAMNSYRLMHGFFADFVYLDRALAQNVYAQFGDGCIQLAEFFLRSRYTSRVALLCDVLTLAKGIPSARAPLALTVAPIVPLAPLPALPVSAQVPVSESPPVATALQASVPALVSVPAAVPVPQAPSPSPLVNGRRPDGIGRLGTGDPEALTELDDRAVPSTMPRSKDRPAQTLVFPGGADEDDETRILTPDEWRREFERTWRGSRPGI